MNERELAIIKAVSEEFGSALSELRENFEKQLNERDKALEEKLSSLSTSLKSDVQEPDISALVSEVAALIPAPELPQLPDVDALVAEAVAALPAPEPTKGEDGRDALQLEVLPFIDEEKSYPRGSYATHSGGLWRAYEKTHGMRGWECLVDGVLGIDVSSTDERNFTVTVTRASGAVDSKAFSIPAMIYRGVFKAGDAYQVGDTVTWGGSMWHCDQDSTDKPGENGSKGWTLATKRGRDGRDKT